MSDAIPAATRCGIDGVAIARIERWLRETPAESAPPFLSTQKPADAGSDPR